jgi:hypothetical protein
MRYVAERWWILYLPYSLTIKPFIQFMTKNNRDGAQTTLYCVLVTFLNSSPFSVLPRFNHALTT